MHRKQQKKAFWGTEVIDNAHCIKTQVSFIGAVDSEWDKFILDLLLALHWDVSACTGLRSRNATISARGALTWKT